MVWSRGRAILSLDTSAPKAHSVFSAQEAGRILSIAFYIGCVASIGSRIFTDGRYIGSTLVLLVVAVTVFWSVRALRGPRWLAFIIAAVGLGLTLTYQHAPGTHRYGLATAGTWSEFAQQMIEARDLFSTAVAPVTHEGGWALLFGVGVVIVLLTTMLLGQIPRAHFEALIPGAAFFIFLSVLGQGPGGLILTVLIVASGYVMAATLRGSAHLPLSSLLITGTTIGLIGTLAVPYIPGADQDPWIITRGRFGSIDARLSPLVDIQGRLVNQSSVEMFVMESPQGSYWRVLTLAEFDGRRFTAPSDQLGLSAESELVVNSELTSTVIDYTLRVEAFGGDLLPSAAVPIAAGTIASQPSDTDTSPPDLRWEPDISAVVRTDRDLAPRDSFSLRSLLPSFTASDLRARTAFSPPHPVYLSLPEDFPQSVIDLTSEILGPEIGGPLVSGQSGDQALGVRTVAGGRQPFEVALALQNWFRSEFDYSLEIPSGHSSRALERFLEERIGYCEQFAAAFVAMARSQGVPSRVAVGFTPGIQRQPGLYSVQGRHAHAWPEVWFDGLGWVPFEPTPGRGLPGAEAHTGVGAQQDGPLGVTDSESTGSSGFDSLDQIPNLDELLDAANPETDTTLAEQADPSSPTGTSSRLRSLLLVLGATAVASIVLAGPHLWRLLRRHRLQRLCGPEQVVRMWSQQLRRLRALGYLPETAMTSTQILKVAPHRLAGLAQPLGNLAAVALPMGFDREPQLDNEKLAQCWIWDSQITRLLSSRRRKSARFIAYFTVWRD
jgi:transglutaminase-like putative cysteine protease